MNRKLTHTLLLITLAAFAASPVLAQKKNDWTLSFPETKERFIKVQLEWAKKDPNWQPTREQLAAKFDQLDTDQDGLLSKEEYEARDGKKPKKDRKKKNQN